MSQPTPNDTQRNYGRTVPKLAHFGREVLYDEVWEDPALSKRERSLITVAALIATYRPEQLPFHLQNAIDNDITVEELSATITHLAFYVGWPAAVSAAQTLDQLANEKN